MSSILTKKVTPTLKKMRQICTVGSKLPAVVLDLNFPPQKVELSKKIAGKKVILMGLPGAFTPTRSSRQIPDYKAKQDALKKKGIEEVMVFCVNDGAVMQAWAKDQGSRDEDMINFYADPRGELTRALGMELTHPGPVKEKGLIGRSKRCVVIAEDGVIKSVAVAEKEDDPAGDDFPEATLVDSILKML